MDCDTHTTGPTHPATSGAKESSKAKIKIDDPLHINNVKEFRSYMESIDRMFTKQLREERDLIRAYESRLHRKKSEITTTWDGREWFRDEMNWITYYRNKSCRDPFGICEILKRMLEFLRDDDETAGRIKSQWGGATLLKSIKSLGRYLRWPRIGAY